MMLQGIIDVLAIAVALISSYLLRFSTVVSVPRLMLFSFPLLGRSFLSDSDTFDLRTMPIDGFVN